MKFEVKKASDWNYRVTVEISTLEELIDFINENGRIIMDSDTIRIYDDYVE